MTYIFLIISVLTAAIGQIMFKLGMNQVGLNFASGINVPTMVFKVLTNFTVLGGLLLYGLSTILWLFALSKLPLNYAYPFTALTLILVMVSTSLILHEALPLTRIIGIGVICVGFIIAALPGR